MKYKSLILVSVLVTTGVLVTCLELARAQAQQAPSVSTNSADLLKQGKLLYKQGDRSAATNLFAQISPADPNYGEARVWYALSLYALGARAQFLAVAETPEVKAAKLPDPLRDELVLKQFEVLYASNRFAELLPRTADYIAHSPRTKKLPLVTEYRMVALYEVGMKQVFAAAVLPPGDAFNRQYAPGQIQLAEFLSLVVARGKADYLLLPNRLLTEETWLARAAVGLDPELGADDLPTLLRLLKDPQIRDSLEPATVSAEREIREYGKLLQQHKYLELLPKLADFPERHPDSEHLWTAAEYRMAALYERGIKELADAAISKGDAAARRRAEGQSHLVEFLNLAMALKEANYVSLPQRKLPEDILKAQTALGNEASALQSVPWADKENASFQCWQIQCKLQPQAVDDHLRRMTNFLNDFPDSKHRARVRYEMGEVVLEEAWQRTYVDQKRGEVAPYLEIARGLLSGVVADKEAGVAEADVQEARSGILRIYYVQRDYTSLSSWAAQMITNSPPGGKKWLVAKLYDAAGLVNQGKPAEAASELDEILATGFKGNPSYDGHLVSAASWRIDVARRTGDEATARRVAQLVQSSDCYGSLKRMFVKKFGMLLLQKPDQVAK